ncbi:MAG: FAS1-like dehydratase domain-containing protein [Promethearchaeota archaeon]
MMLDRKFVGYEFPASEKKIMRWEISQFAHAIMDDNPIYYDIDLAKRQGYKDIPVPPTFFTKMTFSGEGGAENFFSTLGIDYRKLLDGGREFKYYSQITAGDTVIYRTKVESINEREGKRGKMDIVTAITGGTVKETKEKAFDTIITLIVFH